MSKNKKSAASTASHRSSKTIRRFSANETIARSYARYPSKFCTFVNELRSHCTVMVVGACSQLRTTFVDKQDSVELPTARTGLSSIEYYNHAFILLKVFVYFNCKALYHSSYTAFRCEVVGGTSKNKTGSHVQSSSIWLRKISSCRNRLTIQSTKERKFLQKMVFVLLTVANKPFTERQKILVFVCFSCTIIIITSTAYKRTHTVHLTTNSKTFGVK